MNRLKIISAFVAISILAMFYQPNSISGTSLNANSATSYLSQDEYEILDSIFKISLNYFLSPKAITSSGLPLTAFKVGERARYGYSNPTEWGYALQAWIAAAERGLISRGEAATKINNALNTMRALQQNPSQSYGGLFYPYYKVTDVSGNDLPHPYQDGDARIPSGDNALLYASLLITEGWARGAGYSAQEILAKAVKNQMGFRMFLFDLQGKKYLAHQKNAMTGELSDHSWAFFPDEGNVVIWVAYISGSISFEEYKELTNTQVRMPAFWQSCLGEAVTVQEAALYNAMFTWGIRSLAGFPIGSFDVPSGTQSSYSEESFIPSVDGHLAYGSCLGVDFPAFSDAMTQADGGQALVGRYTPPNVENKSPQDLPAHVTPHAFFIPFNALPDLGSENTKSLIALIKKLKNDKAGYFHETGSHPFGFEVVVSPFKDDLQYTGADEGRNVFETLSEAYIALSLYNGLQLNDGNPDFYSFASLVPEYKEKLLNVLTFLYPFKNYLPIVLNNYAPQFVLCDLGDYQFSSNGSFPEEQTVLIRKTCVGPGENTIFLENANPSQSDFWMVWDSLNLRTDLGKLIWGLGINEAPPDYSDAAFDEFDTNPPFQPSFYVGKKPVGDFPMEINDSTLTQIYIHFDLSSEEANRDLLLFLDTLYATHNQVQDFNLRVKVVHGDGENP